MLYNVYLSFIIRLNILLCGKQSIDEIALSVMINILNLIELERIFGLGLMIIAIKRVGGKVRFVAARNRAVQASFLKRSPNIVVLEALIIFAYSNHSRVDFLQWRIILIIILELF